MRITIDAAPREQDSECDDDCEMDHRGEEERGLHGASGAKFGARLRNAWRLVGKSRTAEQRQALASLNHQKSNTYLHEIHQNPTVCLFLPHGSCCKFRSE